MLRQINREYNHDSLSDRVDFKIAGIRGFDY